MKSLSGDLFHVVAPGSRSLFPEKVNDLPIGTAISSTGIPLSERDFNGSDDISAKEALLLNRLRLPSCGQSTAR